MDYAFGESTPRANPPTNSAHNHQSATRAHKGIARKYIMMFDTRTAIYAQIFNRYGLHSYGSIAMPKTMIFLFDGTANDATRERFSNVYAINQLIADRKEVDGDITTQITFYLPGVGTKFTVRKSGIPFLGPAKKIRPVLFGDGIEQMILRAYVNMSANYHPGDEIVLIGFSRGAVAARVFSRLISDFGILSSEMLLHLDKLWNEFVVISRQNDDAEYFRRIDRLRRDLAATTTQPIFHQPTEPPIKFLGVFDTVAGPLDNRIMKNVQLRDLYPASGVQHVVHLLSMHEIRQEFSLKRFERRKGRSTIREMWLPGVHSDVGGGYVDNLISNVSLLTMADLLQSLGKVALQKRSVQEDTQRGERIYPKAETSCKFGTSDRNEREERNPIRR